MQLSKPNKELTLDMKVELDASLGPIICSPQVLETKLYSTEIIDRKMITLQDWKDIDKRFADLNGPQTNNNWPQEEMTISQ